MKWILLILFILSATAFFISADRVAQLKAELQQEQIQVKYADLRYFDTLSELQTFLWNDQTNKEKGTCVELALDLIRNAAQSGKIIYTQIEKDGENSHMWCYTIVLAENRGYFIEPSCDLIVGGDYLLWKHLDSAR